MAEIFNPNPTVFRTSTKPSARKHTADPNLLWLQEDNELLYDATLDDNDVEPIDKDEIFGTSPTFRSTLMHSQ